MYFISNYLRHKDLIILVNNAMIWIIAKLLLLNCQFSLRLVLGRDISYNNYSLFFLFWSNWHHLNRHCLDIRYCNHGEKIDEWNWVAFRCTKKWYQKADIVKNSDWCIKIRCKFYLHSLILINFHKGFQAWY